MQLIDVNEILSAFSLALDLAENKTFEHAQRTAYIALRVAKEMGVSLELQRDIYAAALLHDIGMVNALADIHKDQTLLAKHCIAGSDIVKSLPLSCNISEYILWHHANWDGNSPFKLSGDDIPIASQIIYLADQIDVHLKPLDIQKDRSQIIELVSNGKGKQFSPAIVDAFLKVQEKEAFWLDYSHYNIGRILSRICPQNQIQINFEGIEGVALTFAKIIDSKSHFTHEHSQGVSHWLTLLSQEYGFDEMDIRKMKISGLLHDLGKLAVPNEILDKPAGLTPLEFLKIKSHTYYTKMILSNVTEFNDIKEWAANHHETLDGKGYPEGLDGTKLSKRDRMVAVCDVYQALTEERPYRQPLSRTKVFEIMEEMAIKNKICSETLEDLKKVTG